MNAKLKLIVLCSVCLFLMPLPPVDQILQWPAVLQSPSDVKIGGSNRSNDAQSATNPMQSTKWGQPASRSPQTGLKGYGNKE